MLRAIAETGVHGPHPDGGPRAPGLRGPLRRHPGGGPGRRRRTRQVAAAARTPPPPSPAGWPVAPEPRRSPERQEGAPAPLPRPGQGPYRRAVPPPDPLARRPDGPAASPEGDTRAVPVLTAALRAVDLRQPAGGHPARHRAGSRASRRRHVRGHGHPDAGRQAAGPVRRRRHGRRRPRPDRRATGRARASSDCSWPSRPPCAWTTWAGTPPRRASRPATRRCVPSWVCRCGWASRCSATSTSPRSAREARSRPRMPRSCRRWPPSPGWRSRTPAWPSRPTPAAAGARRPPRWPRRSCREPTPTTCCGRCRAGSRRSPNADMAGVLSPGRDDPETMTIVAAVGHAADDVEGVRVPLADTDLGAARETGEPAVDRRHRHHARGGHPGRRRRRAHGRVRPRPRGAAGHRTQPRAARDAPRGRRSSPSARPSSTC